MFKSFYKQSTNSETNNINNELRKKKQFKKIKKGKTQLAVLRSI